MRANISPREKDILRLLLQGCDNRAIAHELGIAERTVKAYMHKLFMKFQIDGGIKRVKLAVVIYRRRVELGLD